jgi:hypothetical protein
LEELALGTKQGHDYMKESFMPRVEQVQALISELGEGEFIKTHLESGA